MRRGYFPVVFCLPSAASGPEEIRQRIRHPLEVQSIR